jgi:uncharacterized protein YraI
MTSCLRMAALLLALLLPAAGMAADGYVVGNVNLRAGPDTGYPVVRMLPAGEPVVIQGCLDDWSWCDVVALDDRGWVAGNFLQFEYEHRRVYVPDYGMRIGLPIVTFVLGSYWDTHYRHRPWYGRRSYWAGRHFHHHAPRRPAHPVAGPRPHGSRPPMRGTRPPQHGVDRPPAHRPRTPVVGPRSRPAVPAPRPVQRPARAPSAQRPVQRPAPRPAHGRVTPAAPAARPADARPARPNATTRPGTHPAARPAPRHDRDDRHGKDDRDHH